MTADGLDGESTGADPCGGVEESQLRLLYDACPDAAVLLDDGGRVVFANPATARIFGWDSADLVGNELAVIIPERLRDAHRAGLRRFLATGERKLNWRATQVMGLHRDGHEIPIEIAFTDLGPGRARFGGFIRDISVRVAAEVALERADNFRDLVLESTPNAIAAADLSGCMTLANPRLCQMTGYTMSEIIGQPFSMFLSEPHLSEMRSHFASAVFGHAIDGVMLNIRRKDGTELIASVSLRRLMHDDAAVGVVGIAEDVTERVRGDEALARANEFRDRVMQSTTNGIGAIDMRGTITMVNDRLTEMTGFSRRELIGRSWSTILSQGSYTASAQFEEILHGNTGREFELDFARKDGATITARVSLRALEENGVLTGVIGVAEDITERKRNETNLLEQTRLLAEKSALLEAALVSERERARRDTLTGALNHASIAEEVRRLISEPATASLALAMVDVDGLKAVNDTFGHQMGDAVLLAVSNALQADGAIIGRYGGDEFVAILPGADRVAAAQYRQRVAESLASEELRDGETGSRIKIVASIGIAIYPEEAIAVEDLIKLSDSAMYAARRQRAEMSANVAFARVQGGDRAAEIVGEIVPFLTSPGDLNEKLNLVAARLSAGAGYDGVNFALYGATLGVASRTASYSGDSAVAAEEFDAENMPADEEDEIGPLRQVLAATHRPVIIDDIATSEYPTPEQKPILAAVGLQSALIAPMIWRGELLGAVSVGSKKPAAFGPRDAQFLAAIATQVTAIVRTAALVDDLQSASDRLLQAHTETVVMLAAAAEAHDDTTGRHLQRVRTIAESLAIELGHDQERAKEIGLAAVLHDIGKIRVPDYVLASSASLSDSEWTLMKEHTVWGSQFLSSRDGFELAMQVARSHHERWDGSGYPDGLAGANIPEAAAITTVADALDAMINDRPYRPGRPLDDAILEVQAWSGRQFSPRVVDALIRLYDGGDLAGLDLSPAADGRGDMLAA